MLLFQVLLKWRSMRRSAVLLYCIWFLNVYVCSCPLSFNSLSRSLVLMLMLLHWDLLICRLNLRKGHLWDYELPRGGANPMVNFEFFNYWIGEWNSDNLCPIFSTLKLIASYFENELVQEFSGFCFGFLWRITGNE